MRRFTFLAIGIALVAEAAAQTPADTTSVGDIGRQAVDDDTTGITLQTVTVKADAQIHKSTHDVLLLSKENRRFGSNALDAISSLNRFKSMLNATSLTSWDGKEVFVVINGVPATAVDLRTYKADEIKNVRYYDITPPEYMAFTSGPVVDVIVKRRRDRLYSGYINTVNAVTTAFGTNQASLTYADSLNQFKVYDFVGYRNIHHIDQSTRVDYPDGSSTAYRGREKYSGVFNQLNASYQRYQGRHLFYASASYVIDPTSSRTPSEATVSEDNEVLTTESYNFQKTSSETAMLKLNYQYYTPGGGTLLFNIINSLAFNRTISSISYGPQMPDTEAASSESHNRVYSMQGSVNYSGWFRKTQYSIGSSYKYLRYTPTHGGSGPSPLSHTNNTYAAFVWQNPTGLIINPLVGYTLLSQSNGMQDYTRINPYVRLYMNLPVKGGLDGTYIQLTTVLEQVAPTLANLTENMSFIDRRYVAMGNPEVKSYWYVNPRLAIHYFRPKSSDRFTVTLSPRYSHRPFMSVLGREEGFVTLRPTNIKSEFNMEATFSMAYHPLPWLEIEPSVELYVNRYTTPNRRIDSNYLRFAAGVTFMLDKFDVTLAANSPVKEFDGDIVAKHSPQYAAVVQYKYRSWTFGAEWHYSGHANRTWASADGFSYAQCADWRSLRYLTQLTASYSFSIGRARRRPNVSDPTTDKDQGIGKYATPELGK